MPPALGRRELVIAVGGIVLGAGGMERSMSGPIETRAWYVNRGVVLTPEDLSWPDWPDRAARAGLTTVALHPTPSRVIRFIESSAGSRFLGRCRELHLKVEYELHAVGELLPRELFTSAPEMFRMDDSGQRVGDWNLCVHSKAALDVAAENAQRIARLLRPDTGRYFFWGDDAMPWCRCPQCRGLSDSDQALLFANHLARALRSVDPRASVAHLAYANTLAAPTQVRPEANVFLEFAPINRRYDIPLAQQTGDLYKGQLDVLDANLAVFPAATAHVLEYWLDASRFAGWKKPAPRLPWSAPLVAADLETYASRGIRSVSSFGVFLDAEYVGAHGDPPIDEYGALFCLGEPVSDSVRRPRRTPKPPASPEAALEDPYRESLIHSGSRLPERVAASAEPLYGEPAFDPARIWRMAETLPVPDLPPTPIAPGVGKWDQYLAWNVRISLAHIDATFQGQHPKYGTGTYSEPQHDGFPPVIIAAVDALTLWGMVGRAEELLGYWLRHFVAEDGSIRYYAPSLSEHGQLLTTVRRLMERGGSASWLGRHVKPVLTLATRAMDLTGPSSRPRLARGIPEADTAEDEATYFHNNAWLWRGLTDWAWVLEKRLRKPREAEAVRSHATRLRFTLLSAITDTWPRDRDDWWLRPMVEPEGSGHLARPQGAITGSRLGSYTNYRYWPELLSSGALSEYLMQRVVRARLTAGGQWLGMTRFEDHLDDWTLAEYLEGLWCLGMRAEYRYVLWGHMLYHQARGHMTAYEQVSLPPRRPVADYCLPCQLVVARAARRLVRRS